MRALRELQKKEYFTASRFMIFPNASRIKYYQIRVKTADALVCFHVESTSCERDQTLLHTLHTLSPVEKVLGHLLWSYVITV